MIFTASKVFTTITNKMKKTLDFKTGAHLKYIDTAVV